MAYTCAAQPRLGAGAVLEVDDEPVEAGPSQQLRRHRGAETDEGADEGLAGEDALADARPTALVGVDGDRIGHGSSGVGVDAWSTGWSSPKDDASHGASAVAAVRPSEGLGGGLDMSRPGDWRDGRCAPR